MSSAAITIEGLSKLYQLGGAEQGYRTFREALQDAVRAPLRRLRRLQGTDSSAETLWALKDVNLDVQPGEVIGVIGHNGAGKSTLLKILSRITEPTMGQVKIRGRVASLLEVGTGFHPELTGRENIFLNGAILGMQRAEIHRKMDDIIEFAGVERFVDTPVKRYSSGMQVRLAFAVAAHLEPEILIVDEVLAVGDASFQKKCMGKMGDVATSGRTVLLVSHNMEAIIGLSTRALWLEHGQARGDGPAREIAGKYLASTVGRTAAEHSLDERRDRDGNGSLRFTHLRMTGANGEPLNCIATGTPIELAVDYETSGAPVPHVSAWFHVFDQSGQKLLCFWSRLTSQDFEQLPPSGTITCRIPCFPLVPGTYSLDVAAVAHGRLLADRVRNAAALEVVPGTFGDGAPLNDIGNYVCEQAWGLQ